MDSFVDEMMNAVWEFVILMIVGTIAGVKFVIQWAASRNR